MRVRSAKNTAKAKPAGKGKGRRSRRRPGGGALAILALLLIGSAALRLGGGTGAAIARELVELGTPAEAPASESCTTEADLAAVLAALTSREDRLAQRESALLDQVQALNLARTEIDRNMMALSEAEARLNATLARADVAAEDDLARLTSVFESMKAKEAAALFEAMAPDFAAGFLGRMRPDAAAAIMAGLAPDVAYTISVILAGRNADVPRN